MGSERKTASDSITWLIQNETAHYPSQRPAALSQRILAVIWQSRGMAALAGPAIEQDPVSLAPAPVSSASSSSL